jgi:hypothetical protein
MLLENLFETFCLAFRLAEMLIEGRGQVTVASRLFHFRERFD